MTAPALHALALLTDADRTLLQGLAIEAAEELAGTEKEKHTTAVLWRRSVLSKRLALLTRLAQEAT
jgi:hypothetical protein